jgi:hypothetical protein
MEVRGSEQAPEYEAPAGVVLGDVADLTAGGSGSGTDYYGASSSPGDQPVNFPS